MLVIPFTAVKMHLISGWKHLMDYQAGNSSIFFLTRPELSVLRVQVSDLTVRVSSDSRLSVPMKTALKQSRELKLFRIWVSDLPPARPDWSAGFGWTAALPCMTVARLFCCYHLQMWRNSKFMVFVSFMGCAVSDFIKTLWFFVFEKQNQCISRA